MSEALVTPSVLLWARRRRGLEAPELAPKLNVRPEAIVAWEAGDRRPTFRQAQQLARALYVPFGHLFLSDPPAQELPIPDFRTYPDRSPQEPSPEFLDLLNDVLAKQQWFREYRESEGVEKLSFVGAFKPTDPVDEVSSNIRDTIDVDGARNRAPNSEGFLRELTRNAESSGIMIMRSGVVGNNGHRPLRVEEFRGFAIADEVAPVVFINGRDFKGAQIFTFAHELAHIWAGEGGVSNPDYARHSEGQHSAVERFSNRVAAETLVPSSDFWDRWGNGTVAVEQNLAGLASIYKVSRMVILRQAYDLDLVDAEEYQHQYGKLITSARGPELPAESGGNFHHTLIARNGERFTSAVVSSVAEGSLLYREAAHLLNVQVQTLPAVADHIFGGRVTLV